MGKHQRRKVGEMNRLRKRLKFPLARVAQIMPKGFSDEDFLELFKTAYPGLWIELRNFFKASMDEYRNRVKKGLKGIKPVPPKELLTTIRLLNKNMKNQKNVQKLFVLEKIKRAR